jgi:Immunity protein Imm1
VRFRYFDPSQQSSVEGDVRTDRDVAELIGLVLRLHGSHSPAIEFAGHDGSSLMVGISGPRAVLLFTSPEGNTSHSVAASTADLIGDGVVFDYFGAYTEMPAAYSVPTDVAVSAAADYVTSGLAPAVFMALDA